MQKTISTKSREKVGRNQLYENYDELPVITRKVYNFIIESGLTQKEFAEKIGTSQQNICRLFRICAKTGQYPKITRNIREGMMRAFNLPEEWFIADEYTDTSHAPKGNGSKSQLARLQFVKEYLISSGRITSILSLSEMLKASRDYISFVFNGKIEVTVDFLNRLNEKFGYIFDVNWILNGEGEMLTNKDDQASIIRNLTKENEELKSKLQEAVMEIIKLNSELRLLKK